jgi:hypothetical protein
MRNASLLTACVAVALLAVCLPYAHAYATTISGTLYQGQWHSKHLSLGTSPHAWTRVTVNISNYDRGLVYHPDADFDIYLVDQWGRLRAAGTSYGPDSISALMPGTHCTLWIRCAHHYGCYQGTVAVDNGPVAGP